MKKESSQSKTISSVKKQRRSKSGKSKVTLSANTLFHFTNSIEDLISILTNEFQPKYCLDQICLFSDDDKYAIPMICFCDIPLSQIKDHIETYGHYAIGLSKTWGQKKGINPILYSYPSSTFSTAFNKIGETIVREFKSQEEMNESLENALSTLVYTTFFTKPYEGILIRKDGSSKKVRFYNEREWRYVPSLKNLSELDTQLYLDEKQFEDKKLVMNNEKILAENSRLKFEPQDIRYLIVSKEDEILSFMDRITDIKGRHPYKEVRKLHTRIMSIEHMLEDF